VFFVLSKLLSFFTDPVFWILGCFILAFLLKKRLWKRILFISGISLFVILGNGALISLAEQKWVKTIVNPLPSDVVYEYALIQGGFGDFNPFTGKTQIFSEAERIIEPVRLYRLGRIKKLYVTGDNTFSTFRFPESKEVFIAYLESLGVSANDIILEDVSLNTWQSAQRTKTLLGESFDGKNSLLVTSAIHMKRTIRCYRKAGINPLPFATSVPVPYKLDITNFGFGSNNLYRWRNLVHEWVGIFTYRIAGYI
jgi:uncharacterized SAM-binding protein YcdF (DUF218 family)